jgi:hypothetical protein
LPTLYPVSDIALVAGLPQEGVGALVKFLHDPSMASDVATQGMQVMIDESSAAQEWQDGWQSLICQSLQYQRDVLLKKMDVVAISSVEADQVRQLSERLRVECHRRGS